MQSKPLTISELTGASFSCACGREHHVPIEQILIDAGALHELPRMLSASDFPRRLLLVADGNTMQAAGEKAASILAARGFKVQEYVFPGEKALHPDAAAVVEVLANMDTEIGALLAVGSGSITDIVRFAAAKSGRWFASVPTAPSMDGYASSVAPLLVRGFKRTFPAVPPKLICADLDVLCQAPAQMIGAGYGDLLGKLTARADWILSRELQSEYYCPVAVGLLEETLQFCRNSPEAVAQAEPEAIKVLLEGLILSGTAILMVGYSRPASGAEHQIAHFLEMQAILHDQPDKLHGEKVGVATIAVAAMYERLLSLGVENLAQAAENPGEFGLPEALLQEESQGKLQDVDEASEFFRVMGPLAASSIRESRKKRWNRTQAQATCHRLIEDREKLQSLLGKTIPKAAEVRRLVQLAGAPASMPELGVSAETAHLAFRYARYLRSRYTIMDLAVQLRQADEINSAAGASVEV